MAVIPLRDYLSGIEELIDNGQTDEALAHCRHILHTYPKHVDTYRMMGKALLEAHRHSEAGDIFQRVLSSSPDDFVAHIGMSIIREDAGDQDGAIWNMERAFESQPSNRAVQDELRRLYGKREGYAPPKVRLTRGALARMYAHGDLYNQAIGELRGALSEDPNRPDLQVLMAEMYFKTNRETEAMDVCAKLIEKLPYCLFANQAMAKILQNNQRDIEAQPYIDRVLELDPYAGTVGPLGSGSSTPAESVTIQQLVIASPTAKQPVPKAWTGALQASDLAAYGKEELPDWLSFEEEAPAAAEAEIEEQEDTEPSMLGSLESLEPSATPVESALADVAEPELVAAPEEPVKVPAFNKIPTAALADDQVPDWLRELGPATGTLSSDTIEDSGTGDLETAQEQATAQIAEEPAAEEEAPATEEDDGLGWLEKLAADQGAAEEELLTSPEERDQAQPEWAPAEGAKNGKSGTLAWLDELEAENEAPKMKPPTTAQQPEVTSQSLEERTTPTWLRDLSEQAEESAKEPEAVEPRPLDEAPDWINELRPKDEPVVAESAEERGTEPNDPWQSATDLSKLNWMDEAEASAAPAKADAWVPETEITSKKPTKPLNSADAPVEQIMTPRRTARLLAEENADKWLEQARQALNFGNMSEAAENYGHLLRHRLMQDQVIADLEAAVHRTAGDATLWQSLGDAYMRNGQLREALDCYTKAENLL